MHDTFGNALVSAYKHSLHMSDPNVFLAILGLLTYRLLFHSERQLTLFSLIFCMSCAWCMAQLTLAVFKDAHVEHMPAAWQSVLEGPLLFVASCVRPICAYAGLSQYSREHCAAFINMMQGNSSHAHAE